MPFVDMIHDVGRSGLNINLRGFISPCHDVVESERRLRNPWINM
jgi:hypothetical protein